MIWEFYMLKLVVIDNRKLAPICTAISFVPRW